MTAFLDKCQVPESKKLTTKTPTKTGGRMKKILISIGSLIGGGAERVVAIWAGKLAEMGYDIAIYVHIRDKDEYTVDDRVRIESLAQTQSEYRQMSAWRRFRKKRAFIKEFKPDVMMNFLPGAQMKMLFTAAGIKGRRIETIRNNPWIDTEVGRKRFLWNLCFKKADAIIVQTDEQMEYFTGKEKKRCVVIHNPLSEDCRDADRIEYPNKATRFMAAGRLNYQKNFPMLIKAFAQVAKNNPDIYLDIFGNGSEEYTAYLQHCIDESGVASRITLKGRTGDICSALMQHDCFILSSDYEGMPNALAEAMATGMVCVSTDCRTGPKDMIEDGKSGYLAKCGDVASMANAIEKVIAMTEEQCSAMGTLAKNTILSLCDDEANIKKLVEVIEG